MQNHKQQIEHSLEQMRLGNLSFRARLEAPVSIESYRDLVIVKNGCEIWTAAFQQALSDHGHILIPAAPAPYYIDNSLILPSRRHIEAEDGAVIRLMEGTTVLMIRNAHTMDGTHAPIPADSIDSHISINGGRWEEYHRLRAGYGKSGLYDANRSFFGVSTCMLFNHLEHLTLTNMTFAHCAGFAVQVGDVKNAVFENITFDSCYADGLHINGNTENVLIRSIQGDVGDDLVALNAYDWLNSSVDFGPARNILCEDLTLSPAGRYKAFRIQPGVYTYVDGSQADCALTDVIIRRVRGIHTFKLYFQTPAYRIGAQPERGEPGSADHIYFEDIDIDLMEPIDAMREYLDGDPIRGAFASFEVGSKVGFISFENIRLTLHRDRFPLSFFLCIGPKSCRSGELEIFDPYLSSHAEHICLRRIIVNGQPVADPSPYVRVTRFEDVNQDGHSSGHGSIGKLSME